MARKKPYEDGCAAAHALDLIGERWALLIVRELIIGPLRYSDLKDALPGISPNILSRRLAELEDAHVLCRRQLPPPASVTVYDVTEWGAELKPLIMGLGRWAVRSPSMAPGKCMSAASALMSLETMFSPEASDGLSVTLALDLDGRRHVVRVGKGRLTVEAGEAPDADIAVRGEATRFVETIYMGADPASQPGLEFRGDPALFRRFAACFPLPAPWQPG